LIYNKYDNYKRKIKMKKMIIALCAAMMGLSASADWWWTWFEEREDKDVRGCELGLFAKSKKVSGAQVAVFSTKAEEVTSGAQVAIGYSRAVTFRNGAQVALFNRAKSSSLQIGLICVNETGFLPVFVFFNFDKTQFGGKR